MFVTDKAMEEMFPGFRYLKDSQKEQMKIVALKNFSNPSDDTKAAVALAKDLAWAAESKAVIDNPSTGFFARFKASASLAYLGFTKF